MRVEIDYKDGRLGVFDTANLVAGQPFGGACVAAELVLRLDAAEGEGICLDIHHHDIPCSEEGGDVPYADRCRGYRVCLADAGELGGIECVSVDGRAVAWKRAGRFVDGARFERAQRLWYSESPNACENYRACRIYDYLEASRPDLRGDPEAICSLFGYPPEALAEARRAEAAQPAEEVE